MNSSVAVEEDFSPQSLMIVSLGTLESWLLAAFVLAAIIIGVLSRAGIINFILKIAPSRPINHNLLLDQIAELPSFFIANSMLLTSLVTGKPIEVIFGFIGSKVFWISSMVHNTSMAVGGMGIALYRLICIQDLGLTLNIKRAEKLMKQIIAMEIAFQVVINGCGVTGGIFSNEATLMNTAKGHTALMENILNPVKEFHQQLGTLCISFCFFAGTVLMIIELTCYIVIYVQLYKNDEQIKESISEQTISYRRKRNIISLSTQLSGILVEIACSVTGTLIVAFQITDASIFPIVTSIGCAAVPALHLLGSTEMRTYYFSS